MILAVPKESYPGERRVAVHPAALPGLRKAGIDVVVEAGAGSAAGFLDQEYRDKGARLVEARSELFSVADVVAQVRTLGTNREAGRADLELLKAGQAIIGLCEPLAHADSAAEMAERGVLLFAMELMPRITRAQSMDSLSSMATVVGYKAVLLAASTSPRLFPMMMTAAGTITPARVFVLGAGVAGLQAIATARRLGAVVRAYDVRPVVREQVESLGAKFVETPLEAGDAQDAGGYAKQMDEDFYRKQRELLTKVVAESDVVISTAAIPGKKAPVLVTGEMVTGMRAGSVIVDLAAETGGNCAITRPDETVVEAGVTVLGPTNLASTAPYHASQLYGSNISTFLLHLAPEGNLRLDPDDEITRETLVAHDGAVVHPRVRAALGLEPAPTSATAKSEEN